MEASLIDIKTMTKSELDVNDNRLGKYLKRLTLSVVLFCSNPLSFCRWCWGGRVDGFEKTTAKNVGPFRYIYSQIISVHIYAIHLNVKKRFR